MDGAWEGKGYEKRRLVERGRYVDEPQSPHGFRDEFIRDAFNLRLGNV